MGDVTPQELSVLEAAQRLGISADRVRRLCDSGELVHRRVGHGWRLIPLEAVEALAAQRASRTPRWPTA